MKRRAICSPIFEIVIPILHSKMYPNNKLLPLSVSILMWFGSDVSDWLTAHELIEEKLSEIQGAVSKCHDKKMQHNLSRMLMTNFEAVFNLRLFKLLDPYYQYSWGLLDSYKTWLLQEKSCQKKWEHSISTNVARVWFPDMLLYVDWVWWFSTLFLEVFSRVLRFSPPTKNHMIWLVWFRLICPHN